MAEQGGGLGLGWFVNYFNMVSERLNAKKKDKTQEADDAWLKILQIRQAMKAEEENAKQEKMKEFEIKLLTDTIADCDKWGIPAHSLRSRLNTLTPQG